MPGLFNSLFDRVAQSLAPDPAKLKADAEAQAATMSPDEAHTKFMELMNRRPNGTSPGKLDGVGQLPPVPRPPAFRPPINVMGGPELMSNVEAVHKLAPETRGSVHNLGIPPIAGAADDVIDSGINPLGYPNTNLLGQYHRERRDVYINPKLHGRDQLSTVAHEIAHAQGNDESNARLVQALLNRFQPEVDPLEELVKKFNAAGINATLK